MAIVPKSLMTFGAGLLTARAAMRLKREKTAEVQERVFADLVEKLELASVWKQAGVEAGMRYEKFRRTVPLQTYEDLAPYIEQMKKGAADVLWPGQCQIYALTAGTMTGSPKLVPVTEAMLDHFRRSALDSMLWYTARVGHGGIFRSRHLYLGGSTTLVPIPDSEPFEAYAGELSGIEALNLPAWAEKHFYEPGPEIAQIADWQQKIAAITERTCRIDISVLAGMPPWVLILAESLRSSETHGKARVIHLQGIWPNFECYVHSGVPITPYHDELRTLLGPTVNFHEVYPSSEAFIAAQDADAASGLRLMAGAGVFFEFLPMSDYDEGRLLAVGPRTVPIQGVRTGVNYALVLTTPAGLARYLIGDIVRFVSTEPPRLVYVGRTKHQLNTFGEHMIEKEITDALIAVCRQHGWTIVNFHVAPLHVSSTTSRTRGRHEWWIELKPGTLTTPTGPVMAAELDTELKKQNEVYAAKRAAGLLELPFVRLVMPGVFEHWMRYRGKWGGQYKMPRCRNDRVVADELGSSLQFARD
ncbi:MAG TPA: GH3 auxin-responsive promoter family protein [Opitutaceae bacterium]|nr:GH3 auxin-responsive promoter family protein [Opitutaceae bacterium]